MGRNLAEKMTQCPIPQHSFEMWPRRRMEEGRTSYRALLKPQRTMHKGAISRE